MSQLVLSNARVILEREVIRGGVLIRDGRIAQVFDHENMPAGFSETETVDLRESYLAPGMIDIHIHGSAGVDVEDAEPHELEKLSEFLAAEGVTGYFATFVPTDERGYEAAIAAINSYVELQNKADSKGKARACILGIHFEGPYVSANKCGALKREHFRAYDGDPRSIKLFTNENEAARSLQARLMTLAPETDGGIQLVRDLKAKGVRAFIGHSQADIETLDAALEAGACHITHFPNALDPLHHRNPGAVAWGLVRREATLDCIADFHHVAPLMLKLIHQSKTAESMALISDAIKPTGLGDGEFTVWGEKIAVKDGRTSIVEGPLQGTIAGSVITMREALSNIASIGVPIKDAVKMATCAPAQVAGLERDYGSIAEGRRADLFAFDGEFNVKLAIVNGAVSVFER